jgi:hypothetical protein
MLCHLSDNENLLLLQSGDLSYEQNLSLSFEMTICVCVKALPTGEDLGGLRLHHSYLIAFPVGKEHAVVAHFQLSIGYLAKYASKIGGYGKVAAIFEVFVG